MADWNDLKKAFEKDLLKQAQDVFDEQTLLESIAKYLAKNKGITALQDMMWMKCWNSYRNRHLKSKN